MAKRVTYLIGAGASANALPVVNGLKNRMRIFFNYLESEMTYNVHYGDSINPNKYKLPTIQNLIAEVEEHYTIDTLAKKYYLKYGDNRNYKFLKSLMVCYFYFEQLTNKNTELLNDSINRWANRLEILQKYRADGKSYVNSDEYKDLLKSLKDTIDYRYDSFFATLLKKREDILTLPENVNIISWNYDSQFELAYVNYSDEKNLEIIADSLQTFPARLRNNIDNNKSCIIKLNGAASFQNSSLFNHIDLPRTDLNDTTLQGFRALQGLWDEDNLPVTNMKFAWENDEQVTIARNYALEVIRDSDAVVIIGYSFPTFNRDIDRIIFAGFNNNCLDRYGGDRIEKHKKIYIQDTKENAPKIKERLKAVGNNLFEVAEIYDDIDQFFIPPEL